MNKTDENPAFGSMQGKNPNKVIVDDGGKLKGIERVDVGATLQKLTLDMIVEAVPNIKDKMETIKNLVKRDREERAGMSEADKFALGLYDCSFEDEVLIKLGAKTFDENGELVDTQKGLNLALAVNMALHAKKVKNEAKDKNGKRAKNRAERKKKNRAKKKSRKK